VRDWARSAGIESGGVAFRVRRRSRRTPGVVAVLVLTLAALIATGASVASAGVATCTPTGFVRDNIDLTARLINPPGTVSGTVDATGCNIGIYYGPGHTGTVDDADVFGANYFGIVNDGGTVRIRHSSVHDIGETPFNGAQHGNAIYFANGSGAAGSITHNRVWNYQKNGITDTSAGHRVAINHNVVTGEGPVAYIAQNGIEVGFGATATVKHNSVTGNSYTGAGGASSGGILVVGGACFGAPASIGVKITHNTIRGNDVGVFLANYDTTCTTSTPTPTRNVVSHNTIKNFAVNNTSGNGPGDGYQAGVSIAGDRDSITHNHICGIGYKPVASPPPSLFRIDRTIAIHPRVRHNHGC
jgi:hypothetical protein